MNSNFNDDVIICVCSRGEWSDHRSDHPVSAAPRHPGQRPLLPAQERQTPLRAFREARDVSNKPAFISRVKVQAVSCSHDANVSLRITGLAAKRRLVSAAPKRQTAKTRLLWR